MKDNLGIVPSNQPLIIAGPCSAESKEQVLKIARELRKDDRVNLFRAGVWKPRTRPGSFEGHGEIALEWLVTVKTEVGLPVCTEVANREHVIKALKAGIDVLWIGARTTANPFAVQEIAEALIGVDIPVLVKNPVNPDVALWVGAIERLRKCGVKRIGAIHRGVSQFEKELYRNNPEWKMVIQLREQLPELPIINDPSHIAGNRELIYSISQKALDLNLDGLMIETHLDPDRAMSDAEQQVTPIQLEIILDRLKLRKVHVSDSDIKGLQELRKSINYLDRQLLELLSYRMKVAKSIAQVKQEENLTVFQEDRWTSLLEKNVKEGLELGLSEKLVVEIFHQIHQESIDNQLKVLNQEVASK